MKTTPDSSNRAQVIRARASAPLKKSRNLTSRSTGETYSVRNARDKRQPWIMFPRDDLGDLCHPRPNLDADDEVTLDDGAGIAFTAGSPRNLERRSTGSSPS